jgi:curved DNA binding protein
MSDKDEEENTDLSNPDVTTKYMAAAEIANKALSIAIDSCKADADVFDICQLVDAFVEEQAGKLYNKGKNKIEKGIAFPCCITVNDLVGHFSPLKPESTTLKYGDLAKFDLAVHIDGYVASVAHTILIGAEAVKADDKRAQVVNSAWTAAEAILRCVQVGKTSSECTSVIRKCADEFGCNPVQGVLSHQIKKHIIDGSQSIINCETADDKVDDFEFGLNEVYCLDLVMSSGEGKPKESELRTTVFKRALENNYVLKTQKARQFLAEVGKKFPTLPFSLRAFDETIGRVGVSEANRHELLHPYPILHDKPGEFVAQFKYTVLLLPGGTKKVTGIDFGQAEVLPTAGPIKDEEILKLLMTSAKPKKNKKKKAKEAEGAKDGAEA